MTKGGSSHYRSLAKRLERLQREVLISQMSGELVGDITKNEKSGAGGKRNKKRAKRTDLPSRQNALMGQTQELNKNGIKEARGVWREGEQWRPLCPHPSKCVPRKKGKRPIKKATKTVRESGGIAVGAEKHKELSERRNHQGSFPEKVEDKRGEQSKTLTNPSSRRGQSKK